MLSSEEARPRGALFASTWRHVGFDTCLSDRPWLEHAHGDGRVAEGARRRAHRACALRLLKFAAVYEVFCCGGILGDFRRFGGRFAVEFGPGLQPRSRAGFAADCDRGSRGSLAAMALRAVKMLLGERGAPAMETTVRRFTASTALWDVGATPVRGPGAPGNVSPGTKDMDSGEREAVTEGSESPKDVAESVKQHADAGTTDSVDEGLKGKPVAQVGAEKVREDLAGSSP